MASLRISFFTLLLLVGCAFAQSPTLDYFGTADQTLIAWTVTNLPDSFAYHVVLNNRPYIYHLLVDSLFADSSQAFRDSLLNTLDRETLIWSSPWRWTSILTWTAPGDDGIDGTAMEYDLRYRETSFITEVDWETAKRVEDPPVPETCGTVQSDTITNLEDSSYYFAIKTSDEAGNWSDISNIVKKDRPDIQHYLIEYSSKLYDPTNQVIWADTIHYAIIDFYYVINGPEIGIVSDTVKIDSLAPALIGKAVYRR